MIQRGDVFYANLSPVVGSEQGGIRPVVVVQNNRGNCFSPTLIVAPITKRIHKKKLPTQVQVVLEDKSGPTPSMILLEQLRTLDKGRLIHKIARFDQEIMQQVDKSLLISVGIST